MHDIVVINKNMYPSVYKWVPTGRVPRGSLADANVPGRQTPLVFPALRWIKEKGTDVTSSREARKAGGNYHEVRTELEELRQQRAK